MEQDIILEIKDLSVSFQNQKGVAQIIRGVNLSLERGTTLAIVGESGSGKSVTVKSIMGLLGDRAKIEKGSILYRRQEENGIQEIDLLQMKRKQLIPENNGSRIAMVFQDPLTILNPTMTIGNQIMEGMRVHKHLSGKKAWEEAVTLLEYVGIENAAVRMKQYPHQLSGGMRQRVVIAIALSCEPDILICDEPTTALDVTVQAKIIELIQSVQKKRNLSVIYITHDLGVVAYVADTVAVMYAGKIVEYGTVEDVFYRPAHPYTWGLLSSVPDIQSKEEELYSIPGNPPDLSIPVQGDPFAVRNEYALDIDYEEEPPMFTLTETHRVSSWLYDERAPEFSLPSSLKKRFQGEENTDGKE